LTFLERRHRIRCRLACELLGKKHTRTRPNIVALSEGGFALETDLQIEVGEPIRLCILPHRQDRSVKVTGIVWNDRPSRRGYGQQRVLGCVLSDPPPRFLELLAEVEKREAPRTTSRVPAAVRRTAKPTPQPKPTPKAKAATRRSASKFSPTAEPELPRSREPLPPPKPEPEETLPCFRVRVKQVGGSRTRAFDVRAHSMARAAELVQSELERTDTRWQVLEVVPIGGSVPPVRS
jgi:hypothetical protein